MATKYDDPEVMEPDIMRAFELRVAGLTWREIGDKIDRSESQVRRWARLPAWRKEADLYIAERRTALKAQAADLTDMAMSRLKELIGSTDEGVAIKAITLVVDINADALSTPTPPNEDKVTTDAEAAKLLAGATSLPTLPDGVEG
jgi:hypothetical protein